MEITIVYVPCVSDQEAVSIADKLVSEKLAFCANIHQTKSVYEWEGKLEMQPEHILLAKTLKADQAVKRVKELHSYDTPAIITWKAESHDEKYNQWAKGQ